MSEPTAKDYSTDPRKQFIVDYNIAFAESDVNKIVDMMADDAIWELVGDQTYNGKDEIRTALESMGSSQASELTIHTILNDGDFIAANGEMVFSDSRVAFCDVYALDDSNDQLVIKRLMSYGIDLAND